MENINICLFSSLRVDFLYSFRVEYCPQEHRHLVRAELGLGRLVFGGKSSIYVLAETGYKVVAVLVSLAFHISSHFVKLI